LCGTECDYYLPQTASLETTSGNKDFTPHLFLTPSWEEALDSEREEIHFAAVSYW